MVSTHSAAAGSAYAAARAASAFVDRSDRGRVVVSGADRASYLQGLLTNDISALTPGTGCYAAYLTAQGRMIADLYVYELGDLILLSTVGGVKDTVLERLNQFIFTEDVQLGDVTGTFAAIAVMGPASGAVVGGLLSGASADRLLQLPLHGNLRAEFEHEPVIVTRVADTGVAGYEIYIAREHADALRSALTAARVDELDAVTADVLRVEGGVPLFHRDMDEETIPLEAGIEQRAISFTKGCYVGQEVVIRVLHRGHGRVVRKLVGLLPGGDAVPAVGTPISSAERDIGKVTSAVYSPTLQRPIALGYVHRDFTSAGAGVAIAGADAVVTELPFVAEAGGR